MNKYYGGIQNLMRDSKIENVTYLGPFDHPDKLQIGQIQLMIFKPNDAGPFYLSDEKKEELKFDRNTNENEKKIHTSRTD